MIKIKDKHKSNAIKYAISAASLLGPDLMEIKIEDAFNYNQNIYALSNLIRCKRSFNDIKSIIEFGIKDFKKKQNKTPEELVSSLNLAEKNIFNKSKEKYYIIFPINVKYKILVKRYFNLMGTRIDVCSYRHLTRNFNLGNLYKESKDITRDCIKKDLAYLMIESYDVDSTRAGLQAFHKIELLRSIINFIYDYRSSHYTFGSSEPLSYIQPKKYFFEFDSDNNYLFYWRFDTNFSSKEIATLPTNLIENINIFLKKINSLKDEKLRDLILESFSLYGNILDNYELKGVSFLFIWQIFELVSLFTRDDKVKHDDVCKRMTAFFKEKDPYRDIVDVLRKKRNNLVHNGKFDDIADVDINMGKMIAEIAITFLLFNSRNIKDLNGLNMFYDGINYSREEIASKKDILKYIEKIKFKKLSS